MMSRLIFDLRNYHKISDSLGTKQKCARVCVCVCVCVCARWGREQGGRWCSSSRSMDGCVSDQLR